MFTTRVHTDAYMSFTGINFSETGVYQEFLLKIISLKKQHYTWLFSESKI